MKSLLAVFLALCLLLPGVVRAERKPLAVVGAEYGTHDVRSLVRNTLEHEDWVFAEAGRFLPAEEFSKYSLVFIAYATERPYTAQEHEQIADYIRKGGTVVLMHYAPRTIADEASRDAFQQWFGMELATGKGLRRESAEITDDPEVASLPRSPAPSWVEDKVLATRFGEGVSALVGEQGMAKVARRSLGEGKVYFLGTQVFRIRSEKSDFFADSDSYLSLLRAIIAEVNPLTHAHWREEQAAKHREAGRRFLVWDREWQLGTENGPVFEPPLPEPAELCGTQEVEMAQNEAELYQFNLTDLGAGGKVTWRLDYGALPKGAVEWFVQDRPEPIPWPKDPAIAKESPYWLMPPEAVEPKGEAAVPIGPLETRIFWLKLRSAGLAPGVYPVKVEWLVDGQSAGSVELEVRVHPVRLPENRRITMQPFGTAYGDVNDAAPAMRFFRNLQDLGFDWGYVNIFRPQTFSVGGEPLTAAWLRKHATEIAAGGGGPAIDFSALDPYIDASIAHGFLRFRVTQSLTTSIDGLCKNAKLDAGVADAVRLWYERQLGAYFEDKGVREKVASMGDELSISELRERYLPWSQRLGRSGWKASSSFTTSIVKDQELANELAPNVGAWTMNRLHVEQFLKWTRSGAVTLPEGALVGSYGAGEGRGTEIRKNFSASQMIGWEAWALGSDYCSPNPYFKSWLYYVSYRADRGLGGERFVAFLDRENLEAPLVNSPFVEGMRESLEAANLAWMLSATLDKLGERAPAAVREAMAKIAGEGPGAILPWRVRKYGATIESRMISGSREQYRRAKAEVLRLLAEVEPQARQLPVEVFWNKVPLVREGKPVARVEAADGAATSLQEALSKVGAPAMPIGGDAVAQVRIVVGEELPEELRAGAPVAASASRSWVRDWRDEASGMTVVWVGGVDAAQTQQALERFCLFVRAEGGWFVNR